MKGRTRRTTRVQGLWGRVVILLVSRRRITSVSWLNAEALNTLRKQASACGTTRKRASAAQNTPNLCRELIRIGFILNTGILPSWIKGEIERAMQYYQWSGDDAGRE